MKNRNILFTAVFSLLLFKVSAQTSETASPVPSPIKVTAELVSHYVWRGSMATGSPTPNIQPT